MTSRFSAQLSSAQLRLFGAVAICYGVGYPLALLAHSPLGWILVTLGGGFLIALGVVTIRRVHRGVPPRSTEQDVE